MNPEKSPLPGGASEEIAALTATLHQTLQRLEEFGYREGLDRLVAWSLYEQVLMALRAQRPLLQQQLMQLWSLPMSGTARVM